MMVAVGLLASSSAQADFEKLPIATTEEAERFAVLFDFDTDSCYPSPAISKDGEMNGGLKPTGSITGECRDKAQLDNSNTYYRKASIKKDGVEYSVHMYALYFKKDQFLPGVGGHRHDWEFALVWTKDRALTHASFSAHGTVTTTPKGELHFDPGKENHAKVVYHKDGIKTHSFRFATKDEEGDKNAENDLKKWLTPTIVNWDTMKTGALSNEELRKKLNEHDFGEANCSFNDKNFPGEIAKNSPKDYPSGDDWKKAATGR
jgi:hypothetical protein